MCVYLYVRVGVGGVGGGRERRELGGVKRRFSFVVWVLFITENMFLRSIVG